MKRFIIALMAVLLVAGSAQAVDDKIRIVTITTGEIAASGGYTSLLVLLDHEQPSGYFSIQLEITGDGTLTVQYLLSNDGVNFLSATGGTDNDIATGLTKTSGPGSDGKCIYSFNPALAQQMKIYFSETGGANSVTVTAYLAVQ